MAILAANAYSLLYNGGLTDSGSGDEVKRTSTVASSTAATKALANANASAAVLISLSNSALTALRAQQVTETSDYTAYFPTRQGFDASALAVAVGKPDTSGSSAGKSFADVASDARARMDAKYAAMEAAGRPFNAAGNESADGYSLMGDLDRRSLYAVASNAGNRFSAQEQTIARTVMNQQLGLAMGHYTGPADQAASFKDPFGSDVGARFAAAKAFLDGASGEEKQSAQWQQQNALVSQVATQQNNGIAAASGTGQSKTLFDYLAEADQGTDAASMLFNRGAAYAQLAKLKF
jgi:hypothetical protein